MATYLESILQGAGNKLYTVYKRTQCMVMRWRRDDDDDDVIIFRITKIIIIVILAN